MAQERAYLGAGEAADKKHDLLARVSEPRGDRDHHYAEVVVDDRTKVTVLMCELNEENVAQIRGRVDGVHTSATVYLLIKEAAKEMDVPALDD